MWWPGFPFAAASVKTGRGKAGVDVGIVKREEDRVIVVVRKVGFYFCEESRGKLKLLLLIDGQRVRLDRFLENGFSTLLLPLPPSVSFL